MAEQPLSEAWRQEIPQPIFDENPDFIDLYYRAWALAHDHVKAIPGLPQTPYMDEAFSPTNIWIWDTCFMTFFCKYAPKNFPGIESLNNFYAPLYDNYPLPQVEFTANGRQEKAPLLIHIADNPPLFAWAEYSYALMTGNREHLKKLLLDQQYLQRHFAWLENLKSPVTPENCRNATCWSKRPNGYLWEGGRSGMDNTPRGRTGKRAGAVERPNHPQMLWIDAIAQQALTAKCISQCAKLIDANGLATVWYQKYQKIKARINEFYWDKTAGMYYDIHETTHEFMKCLTPASFWPLLAEIPDVPQFRQMRAVLENPAQFGGAIPLVSLSRDDPDFNTAHGQYWRGALWLPTSYMILKGLEKYGELDLAHQLGYRIVRHMVKTYKEFSPHTIWECYAPNTAEPSQHNGRVRPDFCGWSALGPIAIFLENVLGFYSVNAFTRELKWHLPPEIQGKIGVKNFTFGRITTSLIFEQGKLRTTATSSYTLAVKGQLLAVPAGEAQFSLS